jgi:hypothetical protein
MQIKCVPVASVSGWQAESQKRQLSVRDKEDFRCSRSTAEITIYVRDREDFRCSRSTAARKITIHVRDRGGLQMQQVHSCTGNYHTYEGQGGLGSVSNETII